MRIEKTTLTRRDYVKELYYSNEPEPLLNTVQTNPSLPPSKDFFWGGGGWK